MASFRLKSLIIQPYKVSSGLVWPVGANGVAVKS
jgi:hypothetical protein